MSPDSGTPNPVHLSVQYREAEGPPYPSPPQSKISGLEH